MNLAVLDPGLSKTTVTEASGSDGSSSRHVLAAPVISFRSVGTLIRESGFPGLTMSATPSTAIRCDRGTSSRFLLWISPFQHP